MVEGNRAVGVCRCGALVLLGRRWVDRWKGRCWLGYGEEMGSQE
jgi:hypothetical protein